MNFKEFYESVSEKEKWFEDRTNRHIKLVKKYADRVVKEFPEYKDLTEIVSEHDASKFQEPEFTPYVEMSWMRKTEGKVENDPEGVFESATKHHVKNNKHHPEHWTKQEDVINKHDRDMAPEEVVIGFKMPDIYIAEMCCDWSALSEELGTNTPLEWFEKNNGTRWAFKKEQEDLIRKILNKIWIDSK